MRLLSFCFGLLAVASLDGQILSPQPGFVRYENRSVHMAYGIPNNLVIDQASSGFADAISFSDSFGLVAHDEHLTLLRENRSAIADFDAGEPVSVLDLDRDLKTAVAWLPRSHRIVHFDGNKLNAQEVAIDADVTSISSANPGQFNLLVTNADRSVSSIVISRQSGTVLSAETLPGAQGPAFRISRFVIWAGDQGLEIEGPDGHHQTLPFPKQKFRAERMSANWVHLWTQNGNHWALHLDSLNSTVSQIPRLAAGAAR